MTFTHTGGGNSYEVGPSAKLIDRSASGIAHTRANTAKQLVKNGHQRTLIGHPTFHSLRHQLFYRIRILLKIAITGTLLG